MRQLILLLGLMGLLYASQAGASASFPCEPAGSVLISNQPWDALATNGWLSFGTAGIASGGGEPLSPTNSLRYSYPAGLSGGGVGQPIQSVRSIAGGQEMFVGMWWKASTNFEQHPTQHTKMFFFSSFSGSNSPNIFCGMNGGSSPYVMRCTLQGATPVFVSRLLTENVGHVGLTPGNWYRIEAYGNSRTTGAGILKVWVNGTMVISYNNLQTYTTIPLFDAFKYDPIWGGNSTTPKSRQDYFWFDHTFVSRPTGGAPSGNCSAGGGGTPTPDTTAPTPPTGVTVN